MLEISEAPKAPPSRIENILMPPKYAKKVAENGELVDDINKPTHGKFRVDGKVAGKHYEIGPSRDWNKMRVFDDAHPIETSKGKMPLSDFLLKNVRGLTQLAITEGFVTIADADLKVQEEHPLAFLKNKNGELAIPKSLSAEQTQNLMLLIFEKTKNTTDFAERDNKKGLTKILLEEIRNNYVKLTEAGKVPDDPKNPSGIFTEEPVFEALNIACRKAVEARLEEIAYRKTKVFERKGESKGQRLLNRLSIAAGINDESAGETARKQIESLMGVFKDKIVDRDGNTDVDKFMKILDKELLDEPRDKEGKIINVQKVKDALQKIMTDPEYRRGGLEFSVQIDLFMAQAFDVLVPVENRLGMKKLQMQIESTSDYREKADLMEKLSRERQMWRMAILNHFQVERTLPGKTKIPTIADEIRNPTIFTWEERMKIENDYTNAISESISTLEKSRKDLGGFGELDLSAANLIKTEQLLEEVLPKNAGKPDVRAKRVEKALKELFANCSRMVKEGDGGDLKKDTAKRDKYIRDTGLLDGLQGDQRELAKQVIEDAFASQLSLEFKLKKESERIGAPTKPTDVKFGSEINRALRGIELLYRRGVSEIIPEGKRFDLPDSKGKPNYKMIKDDYDVKHIRSTKEPIPDEDYEKIAAAMSQTPVAKKEPTSVSGAPIATGKAEGGSSEELKFFNELSTQEQIVVTYMQAADGILNKARELGISSNLDQAIESAFMQKKDKFVEMGLIEEVVENNKIKVKIKGKEIKNILIPAENDFSERSKQSQLGATNEEKLLMLDLISTIKIGESARLINNEAEATEKDEFKNEITDNLRLTRFSKVSNVLGLSEDVWSGNQLLDAMKKDENIKIGRNEKITLEELSISGIDDLDTLSTLSELLPTNNIFIETLNLTVDKAGELNANPIRNFNIDTLVLTATEDGSEVNLSLIDGSCGIIEIKQGQFNIFTNTVPEMISMADGDSAKASRLILTENSLAEVLSKEGDNRTDFLMGENSTIQIELLGEEKNENKIVYKENNLHKKADGTIGFFILVREGDEYKLVLKPEDGGEKNEPKKVTSRRAPRPFASASSATAMPKADFKNESRETSESVHPRLKYKKLSEVTDEFEKQMDLIDKSTKGDGRAVLSGLYTQVFSEGSGNATRINKGIENFNKTYGVNIDKMMEQAKAGKPDAILAFCDYVTTYSNDNPDNLGAKEFSINLLERFRKDTDFGHKLSENSPGGIALRKKFGLRFIDLAIVYSRKDNFSKEDEKRLKETSIGTGNMFYEQHFNVAPAKGKKTTILTEVFNNETEEAQLFLKKAYTDSNSNSFDSLFGFTANELNYFGYHIEPPSNSNKNRYLLVPDEGGERAEIKSSLKSQASVPHPVSPVGPVGSTATVDSSLDIPTFSQPNELDSNKEVTVDDVKKALLDRKNFSKSPEIKPLEKGIDQFAKSLQSLLNEKSTSPKILEKKMFELLDIVLIIDGERNRKIDALSDFIKRNGSIEIIRPFIDLLVQQCEKGNPGAKLIAGVMLMEGGILSESLKKHVMSEMGMIGTSIPGNEKVELFEKTFKLIALANHFDFAEEKTKFKEGDVASLHQALNPELGFGQSGDFYNGAELFIKEISGPKYLEALNKNQPLLKKMYESPATDPNLEFRLDENGNVKKHEVLINSDKVNEGTYLKLYFKNKYGLIVTESNGIYTLVQDKNSGWHEPKKSAAARTEKLNAVLEQARKYAAENPREPKTASQILREKSGGDELKAESAFPILKERQGLVEPNDDKESKPFFLTEEGRSQREKRVLEQLKTAQAARKPEAASAESLVRVDERKTREEKKELTVPEEVPETAPAAISVPPREPVTLPQEPAPRKPDQKIEFSSPLTNDAELILDARRGLLTANRDFIKVFPAELDTYLNKLLTLLNTDVLNQSQLGLLLRESIGSGVKNVGRISIKSLIKNDTKDTTLPVIKLIISKASGGYPNARLLAERLIESTSILAGQDKNYSTVVSLLNVCGSIRAEGEAKFENYPHSDTIAQLNLWGLFMEPNFVKALSDNQQLMQRIKKADNMRGIMVKVDQHEVSRTIHDVDSFTFLKKIYEVEYGMEIKDDHGVLRFVKKEPVGEKAAAPRKESEGELLNYVQITTEYRDLIKKEKELGIFGHLPKKDEKKLSELRQIVPAMKNIVLTKIFSGITHKQLKGEHTPKDEPLSAVYLSSIFHVVDYYNEGTLTEDNKKYLEELLGKFKGSLKKEFPEQDIKDFPTDANGFLSLYDQTAASAEIKVKRGHITEEYQGVDINFFEEVAKPKRISKVWQPVKSPAVVETSVESTRTVDAPKRTSMPVKPLVESIVELAPDETSKPLKEKLELKNKKRIQSPDGDDSPPESSPAAGGKSMV